MVLSPADCSLVFKGHKSLKDKLKGKFIVLDGPDGCGKSTQASDWSDGCKATA
jgi:putative ribosome biogenesis GTPase RsgA